MPNSREIDLQGNLCVCGVEVALWLMRRCSLGIGWNSRKASRKKNPFQGKATQGEGEQLTDLSAARADSTVPAADRQSRLLVTRLTVSDRASAGDG